MNKQTEEMARAALASAVHRPLLAYLEEKLADVKVVLLTCDEKMFKQQQGRAQELTDLLKFVNSVK